MLSTSDDLFQNLFKFHPCYFKMSPVYHLQNTNNEALFFYSTGVKRVVMMLIYSYHTLKKGKRKDCWKNYSGILTKETYWNTQKFRIAHSQR